MQSPNMNNVITIREHGNKRKSSWTLYISDDTFHDSVHALQAIKFVINCSITTGHEIDTLTLASDGAASYFINKHQLKELKNYDFKCVNSLFSCTRQREGSVDSIGELVEHWARRFNLQNNPVNSIRNAEHFVIHVQKFTTATKFLDLKRGNVHLKICCWKQNKTVVCSFDTAKKIQNIKN